jgi:hypothetical protein
MLIALTVPVLACALPGQQMSQEEQSCCLHMADECNGSQMESHACCNKLPQAGTSVLQVTNKFVPAALDAAHIAPDLKPDVLTITAILLPRAVPLPEFPPGQISVLRI